MKEIAYLILICASVSATVFIALVKWGVVELYEIYRRRGWPETICDFCFCFWLSFFMVGLYLIFYISDIFYIVVPFGAASIGKTLINLARGKN